MRSHGWGGEPPVDADEARHRILAAARDRLTDTGSTSTSEIAELLGVTRQTVYRYFPTTEDLLNAAALDAIGDLVDHLADHVQQHLSDQRAAGLRGDAADAVVEVVAHVYEHLRDDPVLKRLIAPGRIGSTVSGLTAPSSIALGGKLLAGFGLDWSEVGLTEDEQRHLVEHLLRTLQSFVLDPDDLARSGDELRAYLNRWVAPVLRGPA